MPRRLSLPRSVTRGRAWRTHSRAVFPWHDSNDIPEPRDSAGVEEFPWEWTGGNHGEAR